MATCYPNAIGAKMIPELNSNFAIKWDEIF